MSSRTFQFVFFLLIILACLLLGRLLNFDIDYYQSLFARYPPAASGFVFVLTYILTTTFIWLGPKDILRALAAILFGAYWSTVFVTLGEIGNAVIFSPLSRKLGRGFVEQKFKIDKTELDKVQQKSGLLWVLALRSNPVIPSNLLDLGFGLSSIRFFTYILIVLLISPFRVFLVQYMLAMLGEGVFKSASVTELLTMMINFFTQNPAFFVYAIGYFVVVGGLTLLAAIMTVVKKR